MKNIGTKNFDILYFMNSHSVKREFLFFDKIYYNEETLKRNSEFGKWLSSVFRQDNGQLFRFKMAEIEELIEKRRLVPFKPIEISHPSKYDPVASEIKIADLMNNILKFDIATKNAIKNTMKADKNMMDWTKGIFENSMQSTDYESILMTNILTYKGEVCTPLLNYNGNAYADNRSVFINAIIESFPILTIETEWEYVLSFKNDTHIKKMLLALNNWIIEFSKMDLTAEESRLKIAFHQQTYEDHLSIHQAKIKNLKFDNYVVTPLAVLENLLKIKWSEIGKLISEQRKASLELREKKLELTGSEAAYITKTYESFDNPRSQLVKVTSH